MWSYVFTRSPNQIKVRTACRRPLAVRFEISDIVQWLEAVQKPCLLFAAFPCLCIYHGCLPSDCVCPREHCVYQVSCSSGKV